MYELHKGNLALNFCVINNLNTILELPTYGYKDISVLCRILWEFLFGTKYLNTSFIDKSFEKNQLDLTKFKDLRKLLPSYLRMEKGIIFKAMTNHKDYKEKLLNNLNHNKIICIPSGNTKQKSEIVARGLTQPRQCYFDLVNINNIDILLSEEKLKIFNDIIKQVSEKDKNPYGIIATTFSGDKRIPSQKYVFDLMNSGIKFDDTWYDKSVEDIKDMVSKKSSNSFVHIRYTYKQLYFSQEWYLQISRSLNDDKETIKKSVLLEWIEDNLTYERISIMDDLKIL